MKKAMKIFGIIALVAIVGLLLVACGGGSPKSLAKEAFDLGNQLTQAIQDGDNEKIPAINEKMQALVQKVNKLSATDKMKYAEELMKLQN